MRFGGHETFPVREGWLSKGLLLIDQDQQGLDDSDAADRLGVGRNMVKAIRHWLIVTGLAERPARQQPLRPTALGRIVLDRDPYMIEPATWWGLHAELVIRDDKALTWSWFFNAFGRDRFDRMTCVDQLARHVAAREKRTPSRDTLHRDVLCLLSSYAQPVPPNVDDPEEGRESPFRELGLVTHFSESDSYQIQRGVKSVPPAALAYALARRYEAGEDEAAETPFAAALSEPGGPGRVFALDGEALAETVDTAERALDGGVSTHMLGGERVLRVAGRAPEAWLADHYAALGAAA